MQHVPLAHVVVQPLITSEALQSDQVAGSKMSKWEDKYTDWRLAAEESPSDLGVYHWRGRNHGPWLFWVPYVLDN